MAKLKEKSASYPGIGTGKGESEPGSDSPYEVAQGIGTRIGRAADALGTRESAAMRMGVSTDSLQRYISERAQPSFAAVARLAGASGFSLFWLATAEGPEMQSMVESQEMSRDHLIMALELADEALDGRFLHREGYATLLALIYQALLRGLPTAQILELARLASLGFRGRDDDGGFGVG